MKYIKSTMLFLLFIILSCGSNEKMKTETVGGEHRCANCGMITSKYPKWEQKVVSKDKGIMYFDGARCMFKILLDENQHPKKIDSILVKDYYSLKYINAKDAFYVTGSDVLGPMGNELVPFKTQEEAQGFKKDHNGKMIVRFDDVDMKMIMKLAGKMKMR